MDVLMAIQMSGANTAIQNPSHLSFQLKADLALANLAGKPAAGEYHVRSRHKPILVYQRWDFLDRG